MLKVVHLIQHLPIHSYLVCSVSSSFLVVNMSVLVSILILPCKIYVLVSQSARKICTFVFGSCNEVGVIS